MLFLNKTDLSQLDRTLIQEAVRRVYTLMMDNEYTMPDRMHVKEGDNTLLLMPCFSGPYFATKLVSVFPGAPEKGMPAVNGVMVLNDNTTGRPLAIMDGAAVTAERTGAVGGQGVALLTRPDTERAGVFGAGVQGCSQTRYLILNREIKDVVVYDLYKESADRMIRSLSQEFPQVRFSRAASAESLVEQAQVIIGATTTKTPLFENDPALVKGKTFISIGSFLPEMKEFPDAVIQGADHVYVDTPFAAKESGDICQPLDQGLVEQQKILPFAPLVTSPVSLENADGRPKTLFFKSVGMALFDLCVAAAVYEAAIGQNLGTELAFD